jgi:4-carboxymuconolactone decarboxylase
VGERLSAAGSVLRFETSLAPRLVELATITVGAHWKAEFEWWAHSRRALDAGVDSMAIDAIRTGNPPTFSDDSDRVVYRSASELVSTGSLSEETYTEALRLLGTAALVELVSLCGYYTLVSYTLNAFAVPLPPGATMAWSKE